MKLAVRFVLALLVCSTAYAQSGLVGKYNGSYTALSPVKGKLYTSTVSLEINAADGGKLKGSVTLYRSHCGTEAREVEGTYEGNSVKFTQTAKPSLRGCDPEMFEGIIDGDRLVGKVSGHDITLSK